MAELTELQVKAIVEQHMRARAAAEQITPAQKWAVLKLFGGLSVGFASLLGVGTYFGIDHVVDRITGTRLQDEVEAEVRRVVNDETPEWWVSRLLSYNDFSDGITLLVSEALSSRVIDATTSSEDFAALVAEEGAFPTGMIVAFANSEGCPAGWEIYERAAGRMILGADGDEYVYGVRLGEPEVTLEVAQMPRHQHDDLDQGTEYWINSEGGSPIYLQNVSEGPIVLRSIDPMIDAGNDQPHNNMPPYIALYWCTPEPREDG